MVRHIQRIVAESRWSLFLHYKTQSCAAAAAGCCCCCCCVSVTIVAFIPISILCLFVPWLRLHGNWQQLCVCCARAKGAKIPLNSLRVHTKRLRFTTTHQPAPWPYIISLHCRQNAHIAFCTPLTCFTFSCQTYFVSFGVCVCVWFVPVFFFFFFCRCFCWLYISSVVRFGMARARSQRNKKMQPMDFDLFAFMDGAFSTVASMCQ